MSRNVYTSIRLLHILSKVSGFSLYSIDGKSFEVKFKKIDSFFLVLHLILPIVLNVLFWKSYILIDVLNVHNSEVIKSFFPVFAYCNYVASTYAKVWSFCHRHRFAMMLKTFHSIDIDLELFGLKIDYLRQRKTISKTIITTILVEIFTGFFTHYTQHYYNMNISWNVIVFSFYGFYANMIIMNQFLMSISEVEVRLESLNKVLR